MKWLDKYSELGTRNLARHAARRSFLARFGAVLVGAAVFPTLPVARADSHRMPAPDESGIEGDPGNPQKCDYWRYCSMDGFLCSCCGGTMNSCPPGTEPSPITWIGTCRNPTDGKDYIISYNDCCGKSGCGRCFCNTNIGDAPIFRPSLDNDINWCIGTKSNAYHCSVGVVIGVATEKKA